MAQAPVVNISITDTNIFRDMVDAIAEAGDALKTVGHHHLCEGGDEGGYCGCWMRDIDKAVNRFN